jgi:hypothetical protein
MLASTINDEQTQHSGKPADAFTFSALVIARS